MKRVGLIGTGKHGSRYAQHIIDDIPGFALGGINRRDEDAGRRQAGEWNTSFYGSWRELVESDSIDCIIAVTPPGINLEIARACADANKPLLMEKPLARNGKEASEIVQVMARKNVPLTVGQTLRYNPVITKLARDLGEMGELYSFAVNQRIEPSSLAWHDEPEEAGAGVVMHTAVHVFDALRLITGMSVRRVTALSRCVHSSKLEDLMVILVELQNGVMGSVDVSKIGQARSGRFEFICHEGQLVGEQIHGFTKVIRQSRVVDYQELGQVPTILVLLRDWLSFLMGKRENPVSGEDGRYAVEVCQACLQSVAEGGWVDISQVGSTRKT